MEVTNKFTGLDLIEYLMKYGQFSRVRLFATPWTVAHQAPQFMGFSRQKYWSGLPFPPQNCDVNNMKVKVTQLCSTLCDPMDYSLPDSSVHGILQARILRWVAIAFPMGSS